MGTRPEDDASYHANSNILDGLEFLCTLQLRTPLAVLLHHGERFPGPPSEAPKYGEPMHGMWSYRTKSWAQLGTPLLQAAEGAHAADIGLVHASEYLPCLIDFRRVVEPDHAPDAQVFEIKRLAQKHPELRGKLLRPDARLPTSFFTARLAEIPGVGDKLAEALYAQGLHTRSEVRAASDQRLLDIPGLGKSRLRQLRGG